VPGEHELAAERLGLHRSNLYRKMRQLGMETSSINRPGFGDAGLEGLGLGSLGLWLG